MTTSSSPNNAGDRVVGVKPEDPFSDHSLAKATHGLTLETHDDGTAPEWPGLSSIHSPEGNLPPHNPLISTPEAPPPPPEVEHIETQHPQPVSSITLITPPTAVSEIPATNIGDPRVQEPAQPSDPHVELLLAIFPTFDPAVLQYVLESVNGDQDQAVDVLLGMSDPSHVPQTRVPDTNQTDLDAQLAHRLMMEEQEANEAHQRQSRQQSQPRGAPTNLPYEPRVSRRSGEREHDQALQSQFRDFIAPLPERKPVVPPTQQGDLQDQFNKFAETGKKTFNTIFSKVKAKIQEFDAPGGSSSTSEPQQHQQYNPQQSHAQWQEQAWNANQTHAPPQAPPSASLHTWETMAANGGERPQPNEYSTVVNPIGNNQYGGYSLAAQPQPIESPRPKVPSAYPNTTTANTNRLISSGIPPLSSSPPAAPNVDRSKIGLLPKRPVSLVAVAADHPTTKDDEDELEYVDNPFADNNHRK